MADDDAVARGKEAAAVHDQWNVGVATLLVALTFYCFVLPSPFAEAALNYSVLIYMLCDIAYHVAVPHCQPTVLRSVTIMLHHAATLLLVLHPISYPGHASWTRHAMLVEVNTVLHNANKVYKKPLFAAGFYLTWFGLRLGYCPYLLRVFDEEVRALGFAPWEFNYVRAVGSHAVICALNYFWTFVMGYKMLLPKKSKQG